MTNKTVFTKDLTNRKMHVSREFAAPLEKVWAAWTEKDLIEKWIAPKPWHAETKSYSFSEGGTWLYAMVGPEGQKQWSRFDFDTIKPMQSYKQTSKFSDENGNTAEDYAGMQWFIQFFPTENGTRVDVELYVEDPAALEKLLTMGFEGGFTMSLGNLNELLADA
ncbi:MAG: SRPBCC domain-containing protein [Sphingobacteriales bacterium]